MRDIAISVGAKAVILVKTVVFMNRIPRAVEVQKVSQASSIHGPLRRPPSLLQNVLDLLIERNGSRPKN